MPFFTDIWTFATNNKIKMKKLFTLFYLLFACLMAHAQCTIIPFSLEKKVYMSDVVVEARVLSKTSFWNQEHNFIYTANTLEVTTVFKGENVNQQLELITEGGMVGTDGLLVEPSLQVQLGEVGIFLIRKSEISHSETLNAYKPVASVQSFIKYDLIERKALGYFEVYENIENHLFPKLETYTSQDYKRIGKNPLGISSIRPLAAPVISSIDKDTVTGGNGNLLTITGSNFGIIKGKGYVEFLDPNFGDGRFFAVHYPSSYKSWSNSKIEVYVPARAGTGKIRVVNNGAESSTSSDEIYVRYAHSNYPFKGGNGVDSGFFQVKHVDISGNGGYTWQMTNNFAKKSDAVNAFLRAAENWRCGTLMNWDIGSNTTATGAVKDNVNIVQFTRFGDSRLGVCSSWYSGCFASGTAFFHVSELDISFDSTRNWYYGTGTPGTSQYDFETVATHELGHGQQLSHVIDNKKIMHYSLRNGDRIVTLHSHDIEGGAYVREQSKIGTVCFSKKYKAINASDCNITKPKAKFSANILTPCPGTNVKFTDETEGKVNTYSWKFGSDASTASANGAGPYTISYSSSGDKTVELIVSNDFGSDTATMVITVRPGTPNPPYAFKVDTACVGLASYTVDSIADGTTSLQWSLGSGGSISGSNTEDTVRVNWTSSGTHTLSVVGKNICGTSAPLNTDVVVLNKAVANFNVTDDGLKVNLTDLSSWASSLKWKFGDGDSSTEQDPQHTYTTRGMYTISLTASNTCSDSTVTKDVDVQFRVSVIDLDQDKLVLTPNPATDAIRLMNLNQAVHLRIVNGLGQLVLEQDVVTAEQQIDVSSLHAGTYFVTAETPEGQQLTTSFVKK